MEKINLSLLQNIAKERGGKCLSSKYINANTKLKWQCSKGHIWEAKPRTIKNNKSWCKVCSGSNKLTIEEMKEIALSRSGECISNEYKNSKTKLKWKCSKGHIWEATPNNIKNKNSWCLECSGKEKLTIKLMLQIAEERGGKCLSSKYINAHTKLKWQCSKGHIWDATSRTIKNKKSWCLECYKLKKNQRGKLI